MRAVPRKDHAANSVADTIVNARLGCAGRLFIAAPVTELYSSQSIASLRKILPLYKDKAPRFVGYEI